MTMNNQPTDSTGKIICVVGARPNFMKIAPIIAAFRRNGDQRIYLVHTGQHYDVAMNRQFFEQLGIPSPDIDLGVGSASHAQQTAEIMKRFEPVLDTQQPNAVLVVGDVNSTIACALVAAKKHIPVIHIEAGLRSGDKSMPEEINRILTDQLSDLLFTTESKALENLIREGIDPDKVHFVGNVMIDTLLTNLEQATSVESILSTADHPEHFLKNPSGYCVLTLHRPSNVDDPNTLHSLLQVMLDISGLLPLIFPIHPRTQRIIHNNGFDRLLNSNNILCLPPLGYLDMLGLVAKSRLVLTDSGGLQEETTALGIPCVTLRDNTERPITVEQGTNTIVGNNRATIWQTVQNILNSGGKAGQIPELWDGNAAYRIAAVTTNWLKERKACVAKSIQ
jgi:UDP-N-acetylglucosamine 2-epimerase (non-hydrolysing)